MQATLRTKNLENNFEKKVKRIERARKNYELWGEHYKKVVAYELIERTTSGASTLIYLLLTTTSYFLAFFVAKQIPIWLFSIIAVIGSICHVFCLYLLILILGIKYYKKRGDPFRFFNKIIKQSWGDITDILSNGNDTAEKEFHCREIDKGDLENELYSLIKLAVDTFGTEHITPKKRSDIYEEWISVRNDIFTLIRNNEGELIAYVCMIPLKNGIGHNHYNKVSRQFEIKAIHIAAKDEKSDMVFLQAMVIKPEYSHKFSVILECIRCFYEKAAKLTHDDKELNKTLPTIIYAEPVTNQNNEMFKTIGFCYCGRESKSGAKFFELNFAGSDNHKGEGMNSLWSINYIYKLKSKYLSKKDR